MDEPVGEWTNSKGLEAEYGIPEKTWAQWRYLGRGPEYVKIGKHVRYNRSEVARWVGEHRCDSRAVA